MTVDATLHFPRDPAGEGFVDARVVPAGVLEQLSQLEVAKLLDAGQGGLYPLFRRCALAVLNCGSDSDDPRELFERYAAFDLRLVRQPWGVKLDLTHAPASAFVDGRMIRGVQEHLFAVLRDIVYTANEIIEGGRFDLAQGEDITNAVFCILRNAGVLEHRGRPDLVVCWGGHSISREEYDYSKRVGYELGLRGLSVCTGCGPGAMKGPMKGATVAHAKQRIRHGRFIGLTEPGIVAAEPPNPIVNALVILPDIEKRLEAFVRLGHGIVVFPGGVGTAEEILYLLGILLDPANAEQPLPIVFTGPAAAADYFAQLDAFIGLTLGSAAQSLYQVIIDDEVAVARAMAAGIDRVRAHRRQRSDSYQFNWLLRVPPAFQQPFVADHAGVAGLALGFDQPVHERAANLRRMFSAIVSGNVREQGMRAIAEHGPFEVRSDPDLMRSLDALLAAFVAQRRMKLSGDYRPCYRLV